MIPLAIGAGMTALQMILSHNQQRAAEHAAQGSADAQMRFQKEQSETQYQRAVADMKKAGLNPALAYSQGGASSASGASANAPPTAPTDLSKLASTAVDSARLKREQDALQVQTRQVTSQEALNAAQGTAAISAARVSDATALKTIAETEALRAEVPARKSEALFRKKKADIDASAAEYDAIMNRIGQTVDVGSSAFGLGRGVKALKNLKKFQKALPGEPGQLRPQGQYRGSTSHKDGDKLAWTADGKRVNTRTGEIYD